MPRLRFWNKPSEPDPIPKEEPVFEVAPKATGFHAPPPRNQNRPASGGRTSMLIRRRDDLLELLAHQQALVSDESHWSNRIAPVDDALQVVNRELSAIKPIANKPFHAPPEFRVDIGPVKPDQPAKVEIHIGDASIGFHEDIDWAERGTNVVYGELQRTGDPLPDFVSAGSNQLGELIEASLFALASDVRDRALAGQSWPEHVASNALITECPVCGGTRIWNGTCLECEARRAKTLTLGEERNRLLDQRESIIQERDALTEEIPILKRRIADTNHQIENSRLPET